MHFCRVWRRQKRFGVTSRLQNIGAVSCCGSSTTRKMSFLKRTNGLVHSLTNKLIRFWSRCHVVYCLCYWCFAVTNRMCCSIIILMDLTSVLMRRPLAMMPDTSGVHVTQTRRWALCSIVLQCTQHSCVITHFISSLIVILKAWLSLRSYIHCSFHWLTGWLLITLVFRSSMLLTEVSCIFTYSLHSLSLQEAK